MRPQHPIFLRKAEARNGPTVAPLNIMRRGFAGMNAHHLAVAFPKLKVGVPWPPATQELVGLNCRITLWSCPFFSGANCRYRSSQKQKPEVFTKMIVFSISDLDDAIATPMAPLVQSWLRESNLGRTKCLDWTLLQSGW